LWYFLKRLYNCWWRSSFFS